MKKLLVFSVTLLLLSLSSCESLGGRSSIGLQIFGAILVIALLIFLVGRSMRRRE